MKNQFIPSVISGPSACVLALLLGMGSALNLAADCTPPPAGLVSWWQAEGNGNDAQGLNNGTLTNGASFAPGKVGQSFSFTAENQIVQIPNSPSLNPTAAMTLEGWVYVTANPTTDASIFVGKDDLWAGRQYELDVYKVGDHLVFLPAMGTPGSFVNLFGTKVVPLNTWTHVAMTYDGSTFALYVNGSFDTSAPLTGPITTGTAPLTIGGLGSGPWSFFGNVDELSLYNRALSAAEIQAVYNAGEAGKCTTPSAPVIYLQPTNRTVIVSQTAAFAVGASGTQPLSYQWTFNGAAIDGATNATLTLTNVVDGQAGTYAVVITNSVGSTNSSDATLTVNPPPPCLTPPPGLISWWQAEDSPADETGLNNASLVGGVTYAPGMVGQAFALDGKGSYVMVADSPSLNLTNGLTVELWYKDTGCAKGNYFYGLMAKRAPYPAGANFGISMYLGPQSYLQAYLQDPNYYGYQNTTCSVPAAGVFHHVAATYSQNPSNQVQVKLYVDGQLASSGVLSADLARTLNTAPVTIGADNRFEDYFTGLIDEPTVYHRALSDSEILAIYNASISGKCPVPLAVAIYAQPVDQVVTIGQVVTFNVGVSGTQPISYQWSFNGSGILDATNASLTLSNIQRGQAGLYSVVVSNALGSATSSNAVLTVNFPPASVQLAAVTPSSDGSLTLPILLVANGNENALGFSLDFSPTLLNYGAVTLGTGTQGAALFVNTNQVPNGQLGLVISLPSGSAFPAGTQEVAEVSFTTAVLSNATPAQLGFGDQPTTRQLSDPQANTLQATFTGVTVTIPAADFEGDVSPRPGGDKALTVTDWVLVGRYAARLDYPTNASEYQRADCAPRSSLGDGAITVADWVQAGRYAVGLDPITRSGGPTNDLGGLNVVSSSGVKPTTASPAHQSKGLSPRQLRIAVADLAPGQPGTVSVLLDAQGNENAMGFSLSFDPSVLSYTGATLGSGAAGATIDINANQAGSGKLGFVLALPVGGNFAAGTREVLRLSFNPAPSALGSYSLALTDNLAIRQVVDPAATPLQTGFINGSLVVSPFPALNIARGPQNVTLSWPLWATNFTLQQADSWQGSSLNWSNLPVTVAVTNNEAAVTLPASATSKFYRLQK